MTEQEAKMKWCPFARIANKDPSDGASWNRLQDVYGELEKPAAGFCIGSACMAWRWSHDWEPMKPTRVHPGVLKDHWQGWTVTDDKPDAEGYVGISPPPEPQHDGHCGLAGKP